jgi:hypothetical protein
MSYWDTSTLSKLYLPEADSPAFAQKAAGTTTIVTAKLALHEMRRVAFRKESDGLIPVNTAEAVLSQADRDIAAGQIRVMDMDAQTESEFNAIMARCYRHAPPMPIRTLTPSTWRQPAWRAKRSSWLRISACATPPSCWASRCFLFDQAAAVNNLEFEKAALLRDQIRELKRAIDGGVPANHAGAARAMSYRKPKKSARR